MYEKWLQAFHLVATHGGFTAAARVLNIGQPTVSTHVRSLEDHFGVELIYRHGRRVKLAPMGEDLLTITRGMYGHEAEAVRLLESARGLSVGRLNLTAIGPYDVIELLEAFRQRHPGINATVTVEDIDTLLSRIHNFEADVAIVGSEIHDPALHCQFYNRHEVLVIVDAQHHLSKQKQIRIAELDGEGMVLRAPSSTTRIAFEAAAMKAGVNIRPVMEIDSREAMRETVCRRFGFGVVSTTEYAPDPRMRALRLLDAEVHTQAFLLCLKERRDRPIIKAFMKIADDAVANRKG